LAVALGENGLCLPDLQDHVTLLDSMDHAPDNLPFLVRKLRVDALALGVAHAL
jgi:hypothetical protein